MNQPHAWALAGLAAVALTGCAKPPAATQENFATVNGEPISMQDLVGYLERKQTVQVMTPQGPQEAQVAGTLGFQVLRDAIQNRLILQLAKEDGVLPTEADAKKEIERIAKLRDVPVANMVPPGGSMEQLEEQVRLDLARERLLTKGITVTMPEVETFIKANAEQFKEPARAKVRMIMVRDATKKAQVDKDLKAGQEFQTVAIRYSEAPQARQTGGLYELEVVDQFPPALQEVVNKTPARKTSDWIQSGAEWYKFYVQEKTPAKPANMTEERKIDVQRQLKLSRGSQTNDLNKRIWEKLQSAKVEVDSKRLKDLWDRTLDQQKNAIAQQEAANRATAPTSGATTPGTAPTGTTSGGTPPSGAPTTGAAPKTTG